MQMSLDRYACVKKKIVDIKEILDNFIKKYIVHEFKYNYLKSKDACVNIL